MPTVPRYNSPSVAPQALPNVQVGGRDAGGGNLEAFGGGASNAGVFKAASDVVEVSQKIAMEEKAKADQIAHLAADRQASELQTQIQVSTGKMLGRDAAGAPDYASSEWSKGVEKIKAGLSNDDQRLAFDRTATARWGELNRSTQFHMAEQTKAYDNTETAGYLATSRKNAVLNAGDDLKIAAELDRQKAAITDWAKRNGVLTGKDGQASSIFQDKLAEELSKTHKDVVSARLDGGFTPAAKTYFESHKDQMTATDIVAAQKSLEDSETLSQGITAWHQVSGLKLADGQPDEAKMQSAIMAMDLSDKKKEKIWDFVKARAGEEIANKTRQDASRDSDFRNTLVSVRKEGTPLEDALKLAPKFSKDPYEQAVKEDAIKKMYAPPSESDPATKYKLWEGVQEGHTSAGDLDAALQQNKITAKDWDALKQEKYKADIEGRSPEMKSARERVKLLAVQTLGDKPKAQAFELEVADAARGKSPDEYYKIAQDKLKDAPEAKNDWWIIGKWGYDKNYEVDSQKRAAASLAIGKVNEDLGPETVRAIGKGITIQNGGKPFTPADIEGFSNSVGGYQNLKPGTPTRNAIDSLMKRGKPVVPENIKAVLERYPDGRY